MKKESARERVRRLRQEREAAAADEVDVQLTNEDRPDNVLTMPTRKAPSDRVNVPAPGRHGRDGDKRRQPRKQLQGKRWSDIRMRVDSGEMTWEEFCEELTPEELARGRLRDSNGGWNGRPPEWVPRAFFLACQRQLQQRFNEKLQARVISAVEEYIALSGTVDDPAVRERMLRYVMERVMGPVPKEVTVSTEKPWEVLVTKIVSKGTPNDGTHRSRYAHRRGEGDEQS